MPPSNSITVTIKSIKHLKPTLSPNFAGQWNLSPCLSGSQVFDATQLKVPGTGDNVYIYEWLIPNGWSLDGQPSNGTTSIPGNKTVTIHYPANHTEGTIKVRGYHAVFGCGDGVQTSLWSDAINVKRLPVFELTANKAWLFCGDTNPVSYTLTCTNMQLPCAAYFWQNSSTSTANNTFSYTPDGTNDFTVVVRVVYGNSEQTVSKTLTYKVTDPNHSPFINGADAICTGATEYYTIANVPANYNIDWSCTGSVQLKSGQGTNNAEFENTGTGDATIEAQINTNCGKYPAKKNMIKNVRAGKPATGLYPDNIIGPDCIALGESNAFFDGTPTPLVISGAEWYNWTIYPTDPYVHVYPYTSQASARIEVGYGASTGSYTLFVTAENQCGTTGNGWASFDVQTESNCNRGYYMTMFPNPASEYVEISFTSEEETIDKNGKIYIDSGDEVETPDDFSEYQIEIWSESQMLVKKVKSKNKSLSISTKSLVPGNYYLHLIINGSIYKQQLLIEK